MSHIKVCSDVSLLNFFQLGHLRIWPLWLGTIDLVIQRPTKASCVNSTLALSLKIEQIVLDVWPQLSPKFVLLSETCVQCVLPHFLTFLGTVAK